MKRLIAILPALALAALLVPLTRASAYNPPAETLRIGLYYGGSALTSANLQNTAGQGAGFEFGYYDGDRAFIALGASTGETRITMMQDKNMVYNASDNIYAPGTSGAVVVGCFHVQLAGHGTYAEASAAASGYSDAFVKYDNGAFYVCVGQYLSRSDAESARGGYPDAVVTEGTKYTITVVATGTRRILFEFDGANSRNLAVRPMADASGAPPLTWFKNEQYRGDFQYSRPSGEKLTVINFVLVEDYIKGILPSEMSASWPLEALKAQALAARTYAMSKLGAHGSSGFDLCTTEHCQVYMGAKRATANSDQAVDETAGLYITYDDKLCETYYSSSDGGATENIENVWTASLQYLRGVLDPYEADAPIPSYRWTVSYTPGELTSRLKARGYSIGTVASVVVSRFTDVGNVYSVTIKDTSGKSITISKGDSLRLNLGLPSIRFTVGGNTAAAPGGNLYVHENAAAVDSGGALYALGAGDAPQQLPSAYYALNGDGEAELVTPEAPAAPSPGTQGSATGLVNGKFTFTGSGRGHNVGMSQWGAYAMAKYQEMTYDEIIHFYYTDVMIG
ncbi:MAG: SpoIID/LytB domain-containing protein [Oscillospiraceae bacterium]|jgi:stage II sporulation protein D|nr:SpoIID/LytB domain-containing protein [Oscillospiraceae bacterium]